MWCRKVGLELKWEIYYSRKVLQKRVTAVRNYCGGKLQRILVTVIENHCEGELL